MILFEGAPAPAVRAGELDVAGRRAAARAIASSGEIGPPRFRFDPVERRFVARRASGTVSAGPDSPEDWTAAFSRVPPGAVVVEGSAGAAEEVRGAFRAAAEGALDAGRGAYLVDPAPAGLPRGAGKAGGRAAFVALFTWSPEGVDERGLSAAAAAGVPAGVLWPVLPGWTTGEDWISELLRRAKIAGASFAVPLAYSTDADARRTAVEARERFEPAAAEGFFDAMFHAADAGESSDASESSAALSRARDAVLAAGLAASVPRPASPREPAANARAAAHLEDLAAASPDEHRSARLHAAARWIDGCGRDLGAIWREGNLARAFPLGADLARDVEQAVGEAMR